jgi:hypothetical protein
MANTIRVDLPVLEKLASFIHCILPAGDLVEIAWRRDNFAA